MTLEEYLKNNKEKPVDFQKRAGIPHPTVYRYLSGKYKPTLANLQKIMEATNSQVSIKDF